MIDLKKLEVWFVTGSQSLYGEETLVQVAEHSRQIAQYLSQAHQVPVQVVFKPILTSSDGIYQLCLEANAAKNCIGLITWMHTFSPAKMWIAGLTNLKKPFVHLHTQFNRDIPWSTIDMDFMNLNQSAHGDREYGFIGSRLRLNRKVIVGFWQEDEVLNQLGIWSRAACAWHDQQGAKFARFGDNMREVAVTEGDKVEAQIRLGYSVGGYGVGDLVKWVNAVSEGQIDGLVAEYDQRYTVAEPIRPGGRRQFQGFLDLFPGPVRPGPTARVGSAAANGGWLWFRRRRRLEDCRAGAGHKGDGHWVGRRRFLYGRLHLPSSPIRQ
jgi:L-arabinose isomerase